MKNPSEAVDTFNGEYQALQC